MKNRILKLVLTENVGKGRYNVDILSSVAHELTDDALRKVNEINLEQIIIRLANRLNKQIEEDNA